MDTTDEYIKMCCKSEIQKLWVFKDGDYICDAEMLNESFVDVWSGYDAWDYPCYPVDGIWLPRQDQLQDMITAYINSKSHYLLYGFIEWLEDLQTSETREQRDYSMEQLWLTYVMDLVYEKCWDDENWINILDVRGYIL